MIYTTKERGAKSMGPASIVSLHPPDTWHVDSISDKRNIVGDYHLTRLAGTRTRLDIAFEVKRKSEAAPSRSEFVRHLNEIWDKYTAALEKDYKKQTR